MKYGSLFTGICGFDLALDKAGMECAWQCEIDDACRKIEEKYYPNVKRYTDVRQIGKKNLEPVDLIVGGFPCQDLSIAGKREGLAGERSGLWWEFARIIDELEPEWIIAENVPGLLSSNKGRDFAIIVRWLEERGYGVCWRVLDAQYFGVPQRRRRVFIVGHFGDGRSAEILFEREGSSGSVAPSGEKRQGTTTSTLRGFGHGWQGQHNDTNAVIVGALQERDYKGIATTIDNKLIVDKQIAYNTNEQGSAGNRIQINAEVSVTLSGLGGGMSAKTGMYALPTGVRRLTPTECERLQGFPDGWTDGQSDTVRYRQLGNAVAVPCVYWIAKRIME